MKYLKRTIRRDCKELVETRKLELKITEICESLSKKVGFKLDWDDAVRLARGEKLSSCINQVITLAETNKE